MQERRNSIANALELRLSCTNPSMYGMFMTYLSFSHSDRGKHARHHCQRHPEDDDRTKQGTVKRTQCVISRWGPGFAADIDARGAASLRQQGVGVDIEEQGEAMGKTHVEQGCCVGLVGKKHVC